MSRITNRTPLASRYLFVPPWVPLVRLLMLLWLNILFLIFLHFLWIYLLGRSYVMSWSLGFIPLFILFNLYIYFIIFCPLLPVRARAHAITPNASTHDSFFFAFVITLISLAIENSDIPFRFNLIGTRTISYPTSTLQSKYITRNPIRFTILTIVMFAFTSVVFATYDR